jgi:catechol 2,3-dioxygenase-like lactoylglutathione lyase family enzyme
LIVDRTDFVAVPVRDIERSKRFYGETLGLSPVGDGGGWPEFQLGENVSLYLIDPTNISQTFQGPHTAQIVLHPDGNRLMLHRRYAPGG